MRWTRITAAAAVGVLVTGVAACGGRQDEASTDTGGEVSCDVGQDTRVGIATGNATGVYFAVGNAYATQISAATGGKVKATAAETGASVQNIQQLVAGEYAVAFSQADAATDALAGTGSFDGKRQPVQALTRLYDNTAHVIVRTDAGIDSVAQMRGKRISTGSPKSGTELLANRLLAAAGLKASDVKAQRLDLTKTVDGVKDGSVDGLVWVGGLPTPGITDLLTTATGKVKFLDVAPLLGEMQKTNPAYQEAVVPAATYRTAADVHTILVPNLLLVRDDLDANLACALTRALFDRKAELEKANAAAKGISLDRARKTDPVPLHRGAVKALDDLGAAG